MANSAIFNNIKIMADDLQYFIEWSKNLIGYVSNRGQLFPLNAIWGLYVDLEFSEDTGISWETLIHPDDYDEFIEQMKLLHQQKRATIETRIIAKDETIHWIKWDLFYRDDKEWTYIVGTDITQSKHAEQESIELKEFYETMISDVQVSLENISKDGTILSVNSVFVDLYGWKKAEVLGKNVAELVQWEDDDYERIIEMVATGNKIASYKVTRRRKSGEKIDISLTISPIHNKNGEVISYCILSRKYTKEKRLETLLEQQRLKLKEANRRMTAFLKSISDGLCVVDQDYRVLYANEPLKCLFKKSDIVDGCELWSLFPENHLNKYKHKYIDALENHNTVLFQDYFPNMEKHIAINIFPTNDGMIIYYHDNSTMVKSVEALSESERLFERFANNVNDVLWIAAPDFKEWKYISPAFEKMVGLPAEKLMENPMVMEDFIHSNDLPKVVSISEKMLEGEYSVDYRMKTGDEGRERWFRSKGFPVFKDGEPEAIVGVTEEITDQKQRDELLIKSEKLTSVGQLAAGIAHEIRNPLTSIKGFIQILSINKYVPQGYIEIMMSELARIESIVNEFLLLARPPRDIQFQPYQLEQILEEVVSLLRAEANLRGIEIIENIEQNLVHLMCAPNQLKQAFINLIKNAIESMDVSGKINVNLYEKNNQLHVKIIDQGSGIPKDSLEKLGDPFFSTKEKGTGLGLMITMKMIEDHGGTIHFDSEVGIGTTVTASFPIQRKVKLI
ncbi:PAS domain-containing sensor histidine kinase [Bacillus solimangrovi]|uniref:histidine kinase n=1 Tax=Bacillus solimangrovi TaxID=1305675 RepID=A0A1E5LEE5_9BACI|nr:PAS domain-containing sensor histidine kinase [Bacillus solimangrovi]OEH92436.1 hypothetical protein BFG57_15760 [Bacillus solimangrovi]